MSKTNSPEQLKELLTQPGIVRSLGAHDVFTALLVEQMGCESAGAAGILIEDQVTPKRVDYPLLTPLLPQPSQQMVGDTQRIGHNG